MPATTTTLSYLYKKLYSPHKIEDLSQRKKPLLAKMTKKPGFDGDGDMYHPIDLATPQGSGSTFAGAQANEYSSSGVRWTIPRKNRYVEIVVDGIAARAAKSNAGAFMPIFKREMDRGLEKVGRDTSFDLYGDGTGVRGRRSSISTNTITLETAADTKNFEIGMRIAASSTASSSGLRSGSTYVTAIGTGTITVEDATDISGFTNDDYLAQNTDFSATATGLAGYLPLSEPGATSFMGVDRTTDIKALSGNRIDISTGGNLEEALYDAGTLCSVYGADLDACFMHPSVWGNLAKRYNSKVVRDPGGKGKSGFTSLSFTTGGGEIQIYADPFCPTNRVYVLDMSTWFIKYMTDPGFPGLLDEDGLTWMRSTTADQYHTRSGQFWNLVGSAPGKNCVIGL